MRDINPDCKTYPQSHFNGPDGLTKREYFAAMAMQGLLANETRMSRADASGLKKNPVQLFGYETLAWFATVYADALIAELSK